MLGRALIVVIILAVVPAIAQTSALSLVTEPSGGLDPTYNLFHANAILLDYGKANPKLFARSQNFSEPSLTENRELGIFLTGAGILSSVQQTIQQEQPPDTRKTWH
jgi:hypothetical protein